MSVYGDFRNVWVQRFPGSDLPAAWEDDVRANLTKHRLKVTALREELEKEEFYVEYLERLLVDVEKFKHKPVEENGIGDEPIDVDIRGSTLDSKNEISSIKGSDEDLTEISRDESHHSVDQCVGELSLGIGLSRTLSQDSSKSNTQSEYVTVIEVPASNGEEESSDAEEEEEEPYYDSVPADEQVDTKQSNYVNIDYFIHQPSEDGSERIAMLGRVVDTLLDSEQTYLECLSLLLQYMKALKATLTTSQPVISESELNCIFYQIPELHKLHRSFLDAIKRRDSIGQQFKLIAGHMSVYGSFLHNYGRALDAVKQCSQRNQQFADITEHIRLNGRSISLTELLHKPVARIQRISPLIIDLQEYCSDADRLLLAEALDLTRRFLDEFNVARTQSLWQPVKEQARRLVKNSFVIEVTGNQRKLRHLFLFNDLVAGAKYKAAGKDKFDFELKWYFPVSECAVSVEAGESNAEQLAALTVQARALRDRIHWEQVANKRCEKLKKKLCEVEAQLVLFLPTLVLRLSQHCLYLSSEYERAAWLEAIDALKSTQSSEAPMSCRQIQSLVSACNSYLELGSFLLRSGHDEALLHGELFVTLDRPVGIEVDSYGHFFLRTDPGRRQTTIALPLEGSQTLRFLSGQARATFKLSRSWLGESQEVSREVSMQAQPALTVTLRFVPREAAPRRAPGQFGTPIAHVCKLEKRSVPWVVSSCVAEVERRGLNEIGIYRVSGSASDLLRLRKAFETDVYEAELLLREADVHTVTGVLKLFLRLLPEGLFTYKHYPRLVEACQGKDKHTRVRAILDTLPSPNKDTINFIITHLLKVNANERGNKMSLQNIATVFGPTLLRSVPDSERNRDPLASGTVDAMAQASILHVLLQEDTL